VFVEKVLHLRKLPVAKIDSVLAPPTKVSVTACRTVENNICISVSAPLSISVKHRLCMYIVNLVLLFFSCFFKDENR